METGVLMDGNVSLKVPSNKRGAYQTVTSVHEKCRFGGYDGQFCGPVHEKRGFCGHENKIEDSFCETT